MIKIPEVKPLVPVSKVIKEKNKSKLLPKKSTGRKRGPKKGTKYAKTLEREERKEYFRQRVLQSIDKLFHSQVSLATGVQYLFCVITKKNKKTGREFKETVIVKDPKVIKDYFDGKLKDTENEYYFLTTKDPDNKAIDSLLDRAMGKPTQEIQQSSTVRHVVTLLPAVDSIESRKVVDLPVIEAEYEQSKTGSGVEAPKLKPGEVS